MEEDLQRGIPAEVKVALTAFQELGKEHEEDLSSLRYGMESLFDSEEEEEEGEEEKEGDETWRKALVEEVYTRKVKGKEPQDMILSLMGGHHSLWGHRLWNAALRLAEIFDEEPELSQQKCVLELGAGAGLPSFISALNGAQRVVVSDYANTSDQVLVKAIEVNISRLSPAYVSQGVLHAVGYIWGGKIEPLLEPLKGLSSSGKTKKFDLIILADLLFNRSEHKKLLWTCRECLDEKGVVWVSFSHHDPLKAPMDLNFFELAVQEDYGFHVRKVNEVQMKDYFVENDGLDEARGVVYLYHLTLPDTKQGESVNTFPP